MKISWNEWQRREDCLMGDAPGAERALFEARQLVDPAFREAVHWQRATYESIREYGRVQVRRELRHIHRQLFTLPVHQTFAEKIRAFFRK